MRALLAKELSPVLLVIAREDYERAKIFEEIFAIAQKKGRFQFYKFSCEEVSRAILALSSGSLFAENPFVVIDTDRALKKEEEKSIAAYLKNPNARACLLLGAGEKKGFSLYEEIDARGVIFDLGGERAKDREKRLLQIVLSKCAALNKQMQPEAARLFFAKTGVDLAVVESELEKLFCFVGEKERIETGDVELITSFSDTRNLWDLAEDFVWKKKLIFSVDSSLFYPLLSAIRYQLELGLRFAAGEEKTNEPSFFYKKEEEKRKSAQERGCAFFKRFLRLLYTIDLLSKMQVSSVDLLFSYLHLKMFEKKG